MKTKFYFAAFAVAALSLSSCSQDETLESVNSAPKAIEFGVYTGKTAQTRGVEMNDTKLKVDNFGVTAYYTGTKDWAADVTAPNFMHNQKVDWNTTKSNDWGYSPVKYWPTMDNEKISFFAYAPYATSANGIEVSDNSAKTPTVKFTIAAKANDMIDFVAANAINEEQKDAAAGGAAAIAFNFQHELSRMAFTVKTSMNIDNKTTVVLKTAHLVANGKFYNDGVYTFANTETTGTWGTLNALTSEYSIWDIITPTQTTVGDYTQDGVVINSTAQSLFNQDHYLFLIPATTKEGVGTTDGDLKVRFTYDIVTADDALTGKHSVTKADKTIALPAGLLKQGVAYNITLTFNMDEIEVSANVAPWPTNDATGEVDVPFTPDNETTSGGTVTEPAA